MLGRRKQQRLILARIRRLEDRASWLTTPLALRREIQAELSRAWQRYDELSHE